jgi:hypothetical protein
MNTTNLAEKLHRLLQGSKKTNGKWYALNSGGGSVFQSFNRMNVLNIYD